MKFESPKELVERFNREQSLQRWQLVALHSPEGDVLRLRQMHLDLWLAFGNAADRWGGHC